jgi:hypothetical protein
VEKELDIQKANKTNQPEFGWLRGFGQEKIKEEQGTR